MLSSDGKVRATGKSAGALEQPGRTYGAPSGCGGWRLGVLSRVAAAGASCATFKAASEGTELEAAGALGALQPQSLQAARRKGAIEREAAPPAEGVIRHLLEPRQREAKRGARVQVPLHPIASTQPTRKVEPVETLAGQRRRPSRGPLIDATALLLAAQRPFAQAYCSPHSLPARQGSAARASSPTQIRRRAHGRPTGDPSGRPSSVGLSPDPPRHHQARPRPRHGPLPVFPTPRDAEPATSASRRADP